MGVTEEVLLTYRRGKLLVTFFLTLASVASLAFPVEAQLVTRSLTRQLAAPGNAAVAVGDFNHDGKLDVAAVAKELQIFLGNGDGTFKSPINYPVGDNPYSVAVADLNGDGKQDIAVANYLSSTVSSCLVMAMELSSLH